MGCGSIFNVGYEKIYLMQNNLNLKVSEVISTYVYKQGIASTMPQYSMGAAIDLFVSLLNIVMLLLVNRVTKALTESSLW
jgi:putative aldouronate transport system permease protein